MQMYIYFLKKQTIFSKECEEIWRNVDFLLFVYGIPAFYILPKRRIMAIVPIWKDYFVTLGKYDVIPFRIRVNDLQGDIIYTGKSHIKPGETDNTIRINDICADYLTNALPALSQAEFSELTFPLTFIVQTPIEPGSVHWDWVDTVQFIKDWSYDDSYNPATMGMSFPVNGRIDSRQWLVYTAYNASTITATLTFTDGTTSQVIIPVKISVKIPGDFSDDFNTDFARSAMAAGSGTAVFDLSAWDNVESVTINGKTWEVVTDCREWVVYYINAYGGWDSLLIEGNTIETDTLKRHTREMEYDNRSIQNRGTQNYVNEITKSYTLHTSWMSDAESLRMHHLLNSPEVYLFNINTGDMIPVTLNNTKTEFKTYKNNGGRLVNYTIDANLAQERIRR